MKKVTLCMFLVVSCSCFAQQNIFNHVWWEAQGTYNNQFFGYSGLDTIGRLNDTILHAVAIGESGAERLAYNRNNIKADTAPQAHFPGSKVVTGDINGDGIKDYVVYSFNSDSNKITVLFGTTKKDSFQVAATWYTHDNTLGMYPPVVADFDSDGYDDIILSEPNANNFSGEIQYFRGGTTLSSVPTEKVLGESRELFVAGQVAIGHVRDKKKEYLVETRFHGKYANVFLYPFGRNFSLTPSDTLTISWNADSTGDVSGGYLIADANADSIDDIFIGCTNTILVWKGGDSISPQYSYQFPKPFSTGSPTYAQLLVDLGDIIGRGYHTLAVSDPDGDAAGGYFGGVVFLFNLGKALSPKLAAYGSSGGFETYFGTTIIASGNENGKGQRSYMVGQDIVGASSPIHQGIINAFWGDTSFGPLVGVREDGSFPVVFSLSQNYPNPVSGETHIDFSVLDPRLYGSSVTLVLYNEFGNKVGTLYRSTADNFIRSLHFNTDNLLSGNYFYRLECGGRETTRMMTKIN